MHITHRGIVKGVDKDNVLVQLLDNVHCQTCDLKASCGSVSEENLLKVKDNTGDYKLYENVQIIMHQNTGMKAVLFGYVLPFIIMMLFLFGGIIVLKSEWQAGLVALISVACYYVILFVFQKKLSAGFNLKIIKN